MKGHSPLVTIGIPTYNRVSLIDRAIESALGQDYPQIEVIVSDNASTDGTAHACCEIAARDSRLRYVRQPGNIGATRNFEAVLLLASGEYFMWLGDDDWIDPDYVRLCLCALLAEPATALVAGTPHYYDKGVGRGPGQRLTLAQHVWWRRVIAYFWQVRDNGIFYGLARTEVLRSLLPIRNVMAGDWLYIAALASQGRAHTIESTRVHRELGGATASYAQIARSLGLQPSVGRFPFSFIAWAAFADIAWHQAGYGDRGRGARLAIAALVAAALLTRGVIVTAAPARVACRRVLAGLSGR